MHKQQAAERPVRSTVPSTNVSGVRKNGRYVSMCHIISRVLASALAVPFAGGAFGLAGLANCSWAVNTQLKCYFLCETFHKGAAAWLRVIAPRSSSCKSISQDQLWPHHKAALQQSSVVPEAAAQLWPPLGPSPSPAQPYQTRNSAVSQQAL